MDGQFTYPDDDCSNRNDPRNLSAGRSKPIGTLIHTTAGSSSLDWLLTGAAHSGNPASSDYLIDRDGTRHKLCPDGYYPYHAGRSQLAYNNQLYYGDAISELLIGVELECLNTEQCTLSQHDSLAELMVKLGLTYAWRFPYYYIGHYEIALPVGRRSDPLGFLWGDFAGRVLYHARRHSVAGLD